MEQAGRRIEIARLRGVSDAVVTFWNFFTNWPRVDRLFLSVMTEDARYFLLVRSSPNVEERFL